MYVLVLVLFTLKHVLGASLPPSNLFASIHAIWKYRFLTVIFHEEEAEEHQLTKYLAVLGSMSAFNYVQMAAINLTSSVELTVLTSRRYNFKELRYVVSWDSTVKEFVKESLSESPQCCLWILASAASGLGSYNDMSDIYVPYDSQVFLITQLDATYRFHEVYQVTPNHELTILEFGTWDVTSGLQPSTTHIWERRADLQGLRLTGGSSSDHPMVIITLKNGEYVLGGYAGDLWLELEKLLNFTTKIVTSKDRAWGSPMADGSWNGLVGMVHRGEADVAIGGFTVTDLRFQVVDFSIPILMTRFRMFVRRPDGVTWKWTNFLQPYSSDLWWTLFSTILVMPVLLFTLLLFRSKLLEDQDSSEDMKYLNLYDCYLYIYGAFCQQGHEDTPNSLTGRVVYLMTYMTGLLVYIAYSAILISYLTVQPTVLPFLTLRDLLNAKNYQLGVLKNTADYDMFESSTEPLIKKLWKEVMISNQDNFVTTVREGLTRTCHHNYAFFTTYEVAIGVLDKAPCTVVSIPTDYFPSSVAVVMKKKFPYYDAINYHIKKMEENGVLYRIRRKWWSMVDEISTHGVKEVQIHHVAAVFFLLLFGVAIALVIFLVELVTFKLKKIKRRKNFRQRFAWTN